MLKVATLQTVDVTADYLSSELSFSCLYCSNAGETTVDVVASMFVITTRILTCCNTSTNEMAIVLSPVCAHILAPPYFGILAVCGP